MRAPTDTIAAPLFPRGLPWVNVPAGGQASTIQRDRPMLVEFWDFCRPELDAHAAVREGVARALRRRRAARDRSALPRL